MPGSRLSLGQTRVTQKGLANASQNSEKVTITSRGKHQCFRQPFKHAYCIMFVSKMKRSPKRCGFLLACPKIQSNRGLPKTTPICVCASRTTRRRSAKMPSRASWGPCMENISSPNWCQISAIGEMFDSRRFSLENCSYPPNTKKGKERGTPETKTYHSHSSKTQLPDDILVNHGKLLSTRSGNRTKQ